MEESTQTKPTNELLTRVQLPGSTFQLPSRGLFYHNNELAENVEMGEVHIHPMSAYDEILMKTPDMLFSGEAVNLVFQRCIPEVLKPKDLLAKDVDFLLVCLRQITYGDDLEVNYDHGCKKDSKRHSYVISMGGFLSKAKKIDPTTLGLTYTCKVDSGQVVKLKPTIYRDLIKIYQDVEPNKMFSPDEELKMAVFAIKSVIESVDGVTDVGKIEEWIRAIPAGWLGVLSRTIEETGNFGVEFKFKTKCKDCKKEIEIESPINPVSFFL